MGSLHVEDKAEEKIPSISEGRTLKRKGGGKTGEKTAAGKSMTPPGKVGLLKTGEIGTR